MYSVKNIRGTLLKVGSMYLIKYVCPYKRVYMDDGEKFGTNCERLVLVLPHFELVSLAYNCLKVESDQCDWIDDDECDWEDDEDTKSCKEVLYEDLPLYIGFSHKTEGFARILKDD